MKLPVSSDVVAHRISKGADLFPLKSVTGETNEEGL